MELMEAVRARHSVRSFLDKKIEGDTLEKLNSIIDKCNSESGLHIQLVTNEEKAFSGKIAHYGKFNGVKNYIALVGTKGGNTAERCGYYGEKVVINAQQLGLNTCWVALTYSKIKGAYITAPDEKLYLVIAIGYGVDNGKSHKIKKVEDVSQCEGDMPDWFLNGVGTALLAPTAMNQQKFKFILNNGRVMIKKGFGFYTDIDAGIVKYHFEIGSGKTVDN